jgi:hypothetical protein
MAQSTVKGVRTATLIASFVLCGLNLYKSYFEYLQNPTLENSLKYEFV